MTLHALWRLIRMLFVALGAPAAMVARVWGRDGRRMRTLVRMLQDMRRRGRWLRYDGEDDATVARRIARLDWIARDPAKAARHLARAAMARGGGGHQRWLLGACMAPVAWSPSREAPAVLALAPETCARACDTS